MTQAQTHNIQTETSAWQGALGSIVPSEILDMAAIACPSAPFYPGYPFNAARSGDATHACRPAMGTPCGVIKLPQVPAELIALAADVAFFACGDFDEWDRLPQVFGHELTADQYRELAEWFRAFFPRFGLPSKVHENLFNRWHPWGLACRVGIWGEDHPWVCAPAKWFSYDEKHVYLGLVATKNGYLRTDMLVSEAFCVLVSDDLLRSAVERLLAAYMVHSCRRTPEERACHP